MKPSRFHALAEELAMENPLAIRPLLRIFEIRFTPDVATLEVSCDEPPVMSVNLEFVTKHCRTDAHVKAVILHELLHLLLRHTVVRDASIPEEHLAADAVINAIIHRQCGLDYSSMMTEYYGEETGLLRLLRPRKWGEIVAADEQGTTFEATWRGLYDGTLVFDDVRDVALRLRKTRVNLAIDARAETSLPKRGKKRACASAAGGAHGDGSDEEILKRLLGGHHDAKKEMSQKSRDAVAAVLSASPPSALYRQPGESLGIADFAMRAVDQRPLAAWRQQTLAVLRRFVVPGNSRARELAETETLLPVLSPGDRRAFMRSLWSPFLPDARWGSCVSRPHGATNVYLDVSGSMHPELPEVIALLRVLRNWIRMPFHGFSNQVSVAHLRGNCLVTNTTFGTSIACVIDHIARTKPEAAVIVTDGFVEVLRRRDVNRAVGKTRLHALVMPGGDIHKLQNAGIACTLLPKLPRR